MKAKILLTLLSLTLAVSAQNTYGNNSNNHFTYPGPPGTDIKDDPNAYASNLNFTVGRAANVAFTWVTNLTTYKVLLIGVTAPTNPAQLTFLSCTTNPPKSKYWDGKLNSAFDSSVTVAFLGVYDCSANATGYPNFLSHYFNLIPAASSSSSSASSTLSSSATSAAAATTTSSSPATSSASTGGGSSANGAAIGGGVGGGIAAVLIIGGLAWFCLSRRRSKKGNTQTAGHDLAPMGYQDQSYSDNNNGSYHKQDVYANDSGPYQNHGPPNHTALSGYSQNNAPRYEMGGDSINPGVHQVQDRPKAELSGDYGQFRGQ